MPDHVTDDVSVIPIQPVPSGGNVQAPDFEAILTAQLLELKHALLAAYQSCLRAEARGELPPSAPSPVTACPPVGSPSTSGWFGPRHIVTNVHEAPPLLDEDGRINSDSKAAFDGNVVKRQLVHFNPANAPPPDEAITDIEEVSEEFRYAVEDLSSVQPAPHNGNTLQAWGQGPSARPQQISQPRPGSANRHKSPSSANSRRLDLPGSTPSNGYYEEQEPTQPTGGIIKLQSKSVPSSARVSFMNVGPEPSDCRSGPSLGYKTAISTPGSNRASWVQRPSVNSSMSPFQQNSLGPRIQVNSRSLPSSKRASSMQPDLTYGHAVDAPPCMERVSLALDQHIQRMSQHQSRRQSMGDKRTSLQSIPALNEKRNSALGRASVMSSGSYLNPNDAMSGDIDHFARVSEAPSGMEDDGSDGERSSMRSTGIREHFELYQCWTEKVGRYSVSVKIMNSEAPSFADTEQDSDEEFNGLRKVSQAEEQEDVSLERKFNRLMSKFVVSPSNVSRIIWDVCAFFVLVWDFIMLPLEFFDLTEMRLINTMAWVVRLFWTLDFPFSFFTGYPTPSGRVEMRPWKVIRHYVSSLWFPFDVIILSFDWLEMVWSEMAGLSIARLGRTMKFTRLMRMVRLGRLLRIKKLPSIVTMIAYALNSDYFFVLAEILGIMLLLAGCAHILACFWYGLGLEDGWVRQENLNVRALDYRYVTSFSWSLTQLTFGGGEIGVNLDERAFAVGTALVGFLVSVTVVSSITSSMTRLQIIRATQSSQVSMLNQYLFDNGISTKVALRVQRNAMYALEQQKKNTPESSIELLAMVSEPLRVELHYEIHMPVVSHHPFFKCYNEVNGAAMRRLCHVAVSTLSLSRGDVLFSSGEVPQIPCMFFNLHGKMKYQRQGWEVPFGVKAVNANDWACEASPWTPWVHHGIMRARSECKLLLLDSAKFQDIAAQFQKREFYPRRFAQQFVETLNKMSPETLTDLENPNLGVEEMCENVFELKAKRINIRRAGSKSFKRSECRGLDRGLERQSSTWSITNTNGVLKKVSGIF